MMKRLPVCLLAVVTFSLAAAVLSSSSAEAAEHPFQGLRRATEKIPAHAKAGSSMVFTANADALKGDDLSLTLPDGMTVEAKRTARKRHANGCETWIGKIAGDAKSQVVLSTKDGVVAGTVEVDGTEYEVTPFADGRQLIFEVDASKIPACGGAAKHKADAAEDAAGGATATSLDLVLAAEDVPTVDVLVVYTPASRVRYGVSGIQTRAASCVTLSNLCYANSNINMQVSLAAVREVSYVETGAMSTALSRLASKTDGFMDEVHAMRTEVAADLVHLFDEDSDSAGIGYLMSGTASSSWVRSYGFSVCNSDWALSNKSFPHELGHNMGCHHDPGNASGMTPAYAYGYRTPDNRYRTIMSYAPGTRIDYFSSPDIFANGYVMGTSTQDNARRLNETGSVVASAFGTVPPPPASFTITATAGAGGSISPTGTVTANAGANQTFTIAPNSGYQISVVTVDGSSVGAVASYTFSNITANHTIAAAFSLISPPPPPANVLPTVTITSPSGKAKRARAPATFTISASASDSDGTITKVEFYQDGTLLNTDTTSPYSYTWTDVPEGQYNLTAKATDNAGGSTTSAVVTVSVSAASGGGKGGGKK